MAASQDAMEEMASAYFEEALGAPPVRPCSIRLDELDLPPVAPGDLKVPFTAEDIKRTIDHMPHDRAPGPDGFSILFFRCCWDIIQEDLMFFPIAMRR